MKRGELNSNLDAAENQWPLLLLPLRDRNRHRRGRRRRRRVEVMNEGDLRSSSK